MESTITSNRVDGILLERLLNRFAGGIGLYAVEKDSIAFVFASEDYKTLSIKASDIFQTHSEGDFQLLSNSEGVLYKTILKANNLGLSQAEFKAFDTFLRIKAEKLDEDNRFVVVKLSDSTEQKSIDSKLKLNEDIIRLVLSETSISIWDYHVENNFFVKVPYSSEINRTFTPSTPENFVEIGYVHPESKTAFLQMFKDLIEGKEKASGTFLLRNMNTCEYHLETFKFKNSIINDKTGHSIGTSTPFFEIQDSTSDTQNSTVDNLDGEQNIDALTGLYNKAHTLKRVSCQVMHSNSDVTHSALLFDLDNFSKIVEKLGDDAGDEILERFGNLLTSVFYTTDTIGRLGGDEFFIYMPNVSESAVKSMLKEFYDMLLENSFSPQFKICASVGVVLFTNEDFSIDETLSKAEKALQKAKDSGKNKYVVYQ
ncbi:MAG: GGDEF domain-containing protein [Clostridiales bacterium]|nr:GGDEF domain-containing protein [Clostridiales bacterium]